MACCTAVFVQYLSGHLVPGKAEYQQTLSNSVFLDKLHELPRMLERRYTNAACSRELAYLYDIKCEMGPFSQA
jgi:hypothetical protein